MKIKDILMRLYLGTNGNKIANYYKKQGCTIG